ncbi:MAG TPA: amino acid ABC transporter ATP-binding protein [Firmicutes bacterium]|nr:amino acid ABC transporter ATP-binding protein [Bacillota bacterium]
MAGLLVRGLTKQFPGSRRPAVTDFDLSVLPGETVVVMGPSGSGKSTLLRAIDRLIEPDRGEIYWNGEAVHRLEGEALRRWRRQVGFVFQQHSLFESVTVLENCLLAPLLSGLPPALARDRARNALARVGLLAQASRLPGELSGGERQRVAIARALAMEPALMLWDEPTASLDPLLVGEVVDCLTGLAREGRAAMVVVTHDVNLAVRIASRVILMDEGRKIEEGTPGEIFHSPRTELGRKYRCLFWRSRAEVAEPAETARVARGGSLERIPVAAGE